jgi:hypothetical protein
MPKFRHIGQLVVVDAGSLGSMLQWSLILVNLDVGVGQ